MAEGGEPKQDSQNLLRSPIYMAEGGEPKQDSQNQLRSPPVVSVSVLTWFNLLDIIIIESDSS
jgi:hypothetical protein